MMMKLKKIAAFVISIIMTNIAMAQTENMNFEFGNFNNWVLDTGVRNNIPGGVDWNPRPANDLDVQIELTSPATEQFDQNGLDCMPTALNVPTVFPGGLFSARLGNIDGGRRAARISRTFVVTPNEAFLQYSYAIVLEDPSHTQEEQPKFVVNIRGQDGAIVTCGQFEAFAGPNAASKGFVSCDIFNYQILPWTTAGADLTPFIGQQITIEFISLDCTLGAHGGYAYVEATLKPLEVQVEDLCIQNNMITGAIALTAPLGFTSYLWSTGATTRSITIPNAQLGQTFTVDLISNTGCNSSASVTLGPVPSATIDPIPDQEICQGGNVAIIPTGQNTGDFRFTTPDPAVPGQFIDVVPPANAAVLTPTQNTTYTVIARDENGCDGPSTTFTVTVIPSTEPPFPTADFEIEPVIDQNTVTCNTIQLVNLSGYCRGGLTYLWDFGDGSPTSTELNPLHTFPVTVNPETYVITLTVTAQDGVTDSKSLSYTTSSVEAQYFTTLNCAMVTATNISNVCGTPIENFPSYQYTWDFGDGSPTVVTDNTQLIVTHNYATSGMYTITLTINDPTNPTLMVPPFQSNPIDVVVDTTANFNALIDCFDVTFEDLSTACDPIVSYMWNFGDGSPISNAIMPTHTYTTVGPHTVVLTINDGTNNFTHTQDLLLDPNTIIPNFDTQITCNQVTFRDLSNSCVPLRYQWDFGDGSPLITTQNPIHVYEPNNSYTVTLTVNDGSQNFMVTNTVTLVSNFIYEVPENLTACATSTTLDVGMFNLNEQSDFILQNVNQNTPVFPTVSYHRSESDANADINPLLANYNNETNPQTIYARVEDDQGCPEIFPFSLTVFNLPVINTIENVFLCYLKENTIDYDLQQLNARVFDGLNQDNINLTYYLNNNDAMLGVNAVNRVNINAGIDTNIFIRAENANGNMCFALSTFIVRLDNENTDVDDRCIPFFANTMTPNGDGANDFFYIRNIETFPNNVLTIYNRWGNIVYQANGYVNTWDGTHNGAPLPVGNYYYYIELNDNEKRSHTGYITILR